MSERQPFCTCENTYEVDEDGKCLSDVPCINCRIHMCECYECILSPNVQQAFMEKLRVQFQDILELPLWYDAFQRGDPVHKDPSAWTSKQTWKLVWNAKRSALNDLATVMY